MASCELRIELDEPSARFRPGSEIRGHVVVDVDSPVQCNGLKVAVGWFTHGQGNRATGDTTTLELFKGPWSAGDGQRYPFAFPAPTDPLPYAGELLNVDFRVHATADIPWAFDPKVEVPITIESEPQGLVIDPVSASPAWGAGCLRLSAFVVAVAALLTLATWDRWTTVALIAGLFTVFGLIGVFLALKRYLAERKLGAVLVTLTQGGAGSYREGPRTDQLDCSVKVERVVESCTATVALEIREDAVSGSGSNEKSHRHPLYTSEITLHSTAPQQLTGSLPLPTPGSKPYTFKAPSNHIHWEITVIVSVPGWPDWKGIILLQARPASLG